MRIAGRYPRVGEKRWDASFADCESTLTEKAEGMGTDAARWLDVVVGT